jgi:hypothetical protein
VTGSRTSKTISISSNLGDDINSYSFVLPPDSCTQYSTGDAEEELEDSITITQEEFKQLVALKSALDESSVQEEILRSQLLDLKRAQKQSQVALDDYEEKVQKSDV